MEQPVCLFFFFFFSFPFLSFDLVYLSAGRQAGKGEDRK